MIFEAAAAAASTSISRVKLDGIPGWMQVAPRGPDPGVVDFAGSGVSWMARWDCPEYQRTEPKSLIGQTQHRPGWPVARVGPASVRDAAVL